MKHKLREYVVGAQGTLLGYMQSPVIDHQTEVEILHVFEFPATNTTFITVKDLENTNTDRYGKPEPIISTFKV